MEKADPRPLTTKRRQKMRSVLFLPIRSARIPATNTPTPVPAKKTVEPTLVRILSPQTRSNLWLRVLVNLLVS